MTSDPIEYTFCLVHVIEDGKTDNSRYFQGRLPLIGEEVRMVYVGDTTDGAMRLQLRTKE